MADIGLEFGLSATSIAKIAKAAGEPPRHRPKPDPQELRRLSAEGLSQWKLSKHFGVSVRVIARMLRAAGAEV